MNALIKFTGVAAEPTLQIEVAYAEPHRQRVVQISLPAGATVADALALALDQWRLEFPTNGGVGIYGEVVEQSRVLRDGDRLELYRPLAMDPKQARRERALQQSLKKN